MSLNVLQFQRYSLSGVPWLSSGWDSTILLPRARVQSLVRELRSRKPRGTAKKKKPQTNKQTKNKVIHFDESTF